MRALRVVKIVLRKVIISNNSIKTMKINGYEFTEEDKEIFKKYFDLLGRIYPVGTVESKLSLETGSSDYPIGQKYPSMDFETIERESEYGKNTITEMGSWSDLISKPITFLPK